MDIKNKPRAPSLADKCTATPKNFNDLLFRAGFVASILTLSTKTCYACSALPRYGGMDWDSLIFNIGVFIAGVFVLDNGADKFIDHTVIVGRALGVSQTIIALLTAGAEYEEASKPCISDLLMPN